MAVADKLSALRIKASIIADESVGLMEIETDVHDGMAVLTGEVETEEQKRRAEELAYEVEGIAEVENEIKVVPAGSTEETADEGMQGHLGYGLAEGDVGDTAFEIAGAFNPPGPGLATSEQFPGVFRDDDILAEVRERLASQDEVDASSITVSCNNQIVTVRGSVPTSKDLNRLQEMVLNVRGVMGVVGETSVDDGDVGTPLA